VTKLAALAIGFATLVGRGGRSPVPIGLTERGTTLWQLEALLRDTFGEQPVCTTSEQGFTTGRCAPLASYRPFAYVFATARGSRFHIARRDADTLPIGNRPGWVAIRGRAVACDRAETRFLFHNELAAGFSLVCAKP
jgi:hypothetical protein